ncbi:class I glutamine amidotransferase-like protein [Podospora australis]|uniref:Class I glutamine amidotransferase-like protein n=1 Tax=Podospora australis TaxID=1536484 RepID=A0AAN6X167_9PEZI|nr:class I glutamine amidotransferase-like protein [Podospora australis]
MGETALPRQTIHLGVLLATEVQLLDLACVDIFASASHEYLSLLNLVPAPIKNLAPSVKIYYVSSAQPGTLLPLTAGLSIASTHHLSDPLVQPGKLDIVLVPGPDPNATWEDSITDWLAAQAKDTRTDILSVCTGVYLCGAAGLLRGKQVSGPRGLQGGLKNKFPDQDVKWVGESLRWVQDGNFWSCGGVTNGNDLVAAYMRACNDKFPGPVAEFALVLTETGDRSQRYEKGTVRFTLGVVWQILKALFLGMRTGKGKGKSE